MEMSDEVNLSVRRLASRIGISEGYATVILLLNNWDEDSILEKWNQPGSDLVSRSGIVISAEYLAREDFCASCNNHTSCKTYGCCHLLCRHCVKGYVEHHIRSGELIVKCLITSCEKNMSCSRFLDDVSMDCKEGFNLALAQRYSVSRSNNAVQNQNKFASLQGVVKFLQSIKWKLLSSLLFAILVCQLFCGGITFTCVGVYTAMCLVANYACWGNIMKMIFAFFFYKLVTTNSVFTAAALSSAATLVLIFAAVFGLARRSFQMVMRLFR